MPPPLIETVERGGKAGLRYNFHAGQRRAWTSKKRVIAVIAGARSGKTSFGALWLHAEMKACGPGDYLIAGPSYQLLDKAAAPEVAHVFGHVFGLGEMKRTPFRFDFSPAGCVELWGHVPERRPRLLFGHADDPDSLEAMTLKAAWLDECGQGRFRAGSYEAVQRRLAIDRGRVLLTTTPYTLGWLKQKVHDPWEAAGRNHPDIDLIRFESLANPVFPREEYDRARRELPRWRFDMFFRGVFTRPAGLIYDSFDEVAHKVPPFAVPDAWPRYVGIDFGAVNTAAVFYAAELAPDRTPTGRLFVYRDYLAGSRTCAEHARVILKGEPRIPTTVGGAPKTEDGWREAFRAGGLPVTEPDIKDVEVGIQRVYAAHRRGEILVCSDVEGYLDEKLAYSREVDEAGNPTEKIEDKSAWHRMDAERYLIGWLKRPSSGPWDTSGMDRARGAMADAPGARDDGGPAFGRNW